MKIFQDVRRKEDLVLRGRVRARYVGLGFTSINVMVGTIDRTKTSHRL